MIVDNGICSDTSNCVSIELMGINEFEAIEWRVYPLPSHDQINIQIKNNTNKFDLSIRTIQGQAGGL